MKWYNQDRTACLNLDLIVFWTYKHHELHIYVGGSEPIAFSGEDAEDIYNKLTFQKEIL